MSANAVIGHHYWARPGGGQLVSAAMAFAMHKLGFTSVLTSTAELVVVAAGWRAAASWGCQWRRLRATALGLGAGGGAGRGIEGAGTGGGSAVAQGQQGRGGRGVSDGDWPATLPPSGRGHGEWGVEGEASADV